jgi:predicted N-acetyltransferase YhbS
MGKSDGSYIYLADRPDLIPVLASWFFEEWGRRNTNLSQEIIEDKLQGRLNRDRAPLVLIRILNDRPIASASIKIQEMETHPQYLHWLGSVYVLPEFRGQGIGSELVRRTIDEARRLDVDELYLYTRDNENFYSKLGWHAVEDTTYHSRRAIIMKKILSVEERKNQ